MLPSLVRGWVQDLEDVAHHDQVSVVVIQGQFHGHDIAQHIQARSALAILALHCHLLICVEKPKELEGLDDAFDGCLYIAAVVEVREVDAGQGALDQVLICCVHALYGLVDHIFSWAERGVVEVHSLEPRFEQVSKSLYAGVRVVVGGQADVVEGRNDSAEACKPDRTPNESLAILHSELVHEIQAVSIRIRFQLHRHRKVISVFSPF